ncbi:MAG: PilT/PilU family type 4a pilus ATPase, partial [Lachnospiraceae bacterium]|nr:PilT/PilU family type 4a pilus ATPase [Lachnospiraceae bacterium]
MEIQEVLKKMTELGASDIFLIAGRPISYKLNQKIGIYGDQRLTPPILDVYIKEIYELARRSGADRLYVTGDDDFSFAIIGYARFRVSTFKQRGSLAAVIRVIAFHLPNAFELGIPDSIIHMGDYGKGLVLVTGAAGSGKSTTLACIIDYINHNKEEHIITLEDPLEFLHSHDKCIVTQREINSDTESYITALRAAMRQSPDVILLGEMRDYETIQVAMTAAETGHLIFSTLHTMGAANTIDRIIDVFPANQQRQISVQLSMVLQAVISQQLVPGVDGGLIPVFEIM